MKRKILLALIVVVLLSVLGITVFFYDKYQNTEDVLTKKYCKEIEDNIVLNENESVITAVKADMNNDSKQDYVLLVGKTNANNNKENKLADFNPEVETYTAVSLEIVNGENKEVKRHDTQKSFNGNVELKIQSDSQKQYVIVSDNSTGNVILDVFENNEFVDVIKNSIDADLNGYSFTTVWNEEDDTKLKVKLDNYGRTYLKENTEEYVLDFSDTQITKDVYRQSYTANKFASIELNDIDNDGIFELKCKQNILYLNTSSDTLPKNAGVISITFKIAENKLVYNSVEVSK